MTQSKVVGITGGTGCGKTVLCRSLNECGACVIDCDHISHALMDTMADAIRGAFGDDVMDTSGAVTVDRQKLGALVFSDNNLIKKLNALMHPPIVKETISRLNGLKERGDGLIVIDAPLLVETGLDSCCDAVWLVQACTERRIQYIQSRDNLTTEQALARIKSREDTAARFSRADLIIVNSGTADDLVRLAKELYHLYMEVE